MGIIRNHINSTTYIVIAFLTLLHILSCSDKSGNEKPNIILILADDLGYGDLGCYGQEIIETPNIDNLAESGIMFTEHYSGSPVCAPSRYTLLTGKHSGHAVIRGNDEWQSRGDVWNYEAMFNDSTLEGQRPLPEGEVLLPQLLRDNGYNTAMFGKWGLGAPHKSSIPTKKGFNTFLGYNCQRIAHTYYPTHLYQNENRLYLNNELLAPHTKLEEGADANDDRSYDRFTLSEYAPDVIFNGILDFIDKDHTKPFFIYWATPIPHVPLQAPAEMVNYYRKKIGEETPYLATNGYFPCQYPKATYAAMITYLDNNIGILINKLKEYGIYENTIIIFTSDNGPTYAGGVDAKYFKSAGIHNDDNNRIKGSLYEGGIKVPLIVNWPNLTSEAKKLDIVCSSYDTYNTILDIAQTSIPMYSDGISYLPALKNSQRQPFHNYLYWEFPERDGMQAVRKGKWKGVRNNIKSGNMDIELYDLNADPKELNDISEKHPDIVREIIEIMEAEHSEPEIETFKMKTLGDLHN